MDRDIGTAARVLEEAATKYRDEVTKLTWLRAKPYINYARPYKKRDPYPLDWEEQRLLFGREAPMGFRRIRVHDLRRTFGEACAPLVLRSRTVRIC